MFMIACDISLSKKVHYFVLTKILVLILGAFVQFYFISGVSKTSLHQNIAWYTTKEQVCV